MKTDITTEEEFGGMMLNIVRALDAMRAAPWQRLKKMREAKGNDAELDKLSSQPPEKQSDIVMMAIYTGRAEQMLMDRFDANERITLQDIETVFKDIEENTQLKRMPSDGSIPTALLETEILFKEQFKHIINPDRGQQPAR